MGHTPAFYADIPGFLLRVARAQGDVGRFRLWNRPSLLFSHPDGVAAVLVENASRLGKGGLMQRARRLMGDGLLTSEGEAHLAQRRRIQPAFARAQVERYAAAMPRVIAEREAGWREGGRVALNQEMDRLTVSVVARTLFGRDVEEDLPALSHALSALAKWAPMLALTGGWLERVRLPPMHRVSTALDVLESSIARFASEGFERSPLLTALLTPREGEAVDAQRVRDEVMTIFLAAHDTTSAALSWTWLLLSAHPRVDERLRQELAEVTRGEEVQASDSSNLTYARMVVEEVLRLYPPIARMGRRPLEDVEIAGVHVPVGTRVFVSPFVTQRDERWFDRPDKFIPERWSVETDRPSFAFFPFGGGRRSCIGESFARQVLLMAVATLTQRWSLRGPAKLPRPRSLLTTKPRSSPRVQVCPIR